LMVEHEIVTHGPNALFELTGVVERVARELGDGVVVVFSKGSTGALVVIPSEAAEEYRDAIWGLVPLEGWEHPGNAYAHLRSTLIGTSIFIPVSGGQLGIPEGYGVFFLENQVANARHRKIYIAGLPG